MFKEKNTNTNVDRKWAGNEQKIDFVGYPMSPAGEDIYIQYLEKANIDAQDIFHNKESNGINIAEESNEARDNDTYDENANFNGEELGNDLDFPGNEENNYYNLGSYEHNNLEEGQGQIILMS